MTRRIVLIIVFLLLGFFIAFSAASHPYAGPPHDAPLTFIQHKTDDGRSIFTNIPKKCFSKGRLICVKPHIGKVIVVRLHVHEDPREDTVHIRSAHGSSPLLPCIPQARKQDADQQRDDRDDHEDFDQGETARAIGQAASSHGSHSRTSTGYVNGDR